MNRCLIVVSRNRPDLELELRQAYAPGVGVDIIVDRRRRQRWMWPGEGAVRPPSRTDLDLQRQGFAVVPRP
jgi:hypothetical protein